MTAESSTFWDNEVVARNHVEWMGHPLVRDHMNQLIGADSPRWPFDLFESWLHGRNFDRGLSIGCGTGALERDIIRRNLCRHVDALDGSIVSLALAKQEARASVMGDRIGYFAADFNAPAFPRRRYDVVFFHQSAHHVARLEPLYSSILSTLRPGGLLYLDEFVGPSRDSWEDALLERQREIYRGIPREMRLYDDLPFPIQWDDPSEAVRSGEIEEQLQVGFDVLLRRDYGGTLLSVVMPALLPESIDDAMVQRLIQQERELLRDGLKSYYTIIVARPKAWPMRSLARVRYFAEPRIKRFVARVRARLSRPSPQA